MWTQSQSTELAFSNINVTIKSKPILHDISGIATSGTLFAVMGPSGSGKSTLMNALAGRLAVSDGLVTLKGLPLTKQLRRRIAYVTQEDMFFSELTLWETLYFTAMTRLPDSTPRAEKIAKIDQIAKALDLQKCLHTVIGDMFVRGLSGGEKKRASIACELLTDPDVMLLDEPTSGLDSSTASSLMLQLKDYATTFNKTVVLTIHQPSSQLYHMFNNLLLLVNGHEAYSGTTDKALTHFECMGLRCETHYNPADFMLEMLKSDEATIQKIIDTANLFRKSHFPKNSKGIDNKAYCHTSMENISISIPEKCESNIIGMAYGKLENSPAGKHIRDATLVVESQHPKWPTSFWTQYRMLTWRNFKQAKSRILHPYPITQMFILALVAGTVYFQIDPTADTLRDRMGLVFFSVTYWMFGSAVDAITSFPSERGVIQKERSGGAYRLSAYYLAKMSSELPLIITLPVCFFSIVYWMAGLSGVCQFFSSLGILLLSNLIAQGIGFCVGAALMDIKLGMVSTQTIILMFLLLGGFFNQTMPDWLVWTRFVSLISYPFYSISIAIFSDMQPVNCSSLSALSLSRCFSNDTELVTADDILKSVGITLPIYFYVGTMAAFCIAFRIAGYFILRLKLSPPK